MLRILPTIIIMALLIVPMVVANPFTDFWNWITGKDTGIELATQGIQILDERTICDLDNGNCEIYAGNKFYYYEGVFYNHSTFLNDYSTRLNQDIVFSYLDGTIITYTPMVNLNSQISPIRNLDIVVAGQLTYESLLEEDRDNSKLNLQFRKVTGLREIGYQISSNSPIEYQVKEFIRSGVYEQGREEKYNFTLLKIGNVIHSPIDIIEGGDRISFDQETNILLINLSNYEEDRLITLDPFSSIFSSATDGFVVIEEPNTCIASDNTSITASVGDNHIISPELMNIGLVEFNTSSIPDTAFINEANFTVYANSFVKHVSLDNNWTVTTVSKKTSFGDGLGCGDQTGFTGSIENLDWAGVIGNKTVDVPSAQINLTGFTAFSLGANFWLHVPTGMQKVTNFRTSRHSETNSTPVLSIRFNEGVCTNFYEIGDFEVDVGTEVNCTAEQFSVTGKINISGILYLRNNTNMSCNDSISNHVYPPGQILSHNQSELIC